MAIPTALPVSAEMIEDIFIGLHEAVAGHLGSAG